MPNLIETEAQLNPDIDTETETLTEEPVTQCFICDVPLYKDEIASETVNSHPIGNGRIAAAHVQCLEEALANHAADMAWREVNDKYEGFAEDWATLCFEHLPQQKVLLSYNGETCIRSGSLNEIVAARGVGKSFFTAALVKVIINGGELLRFKSIGGNRVLLVDGELPGPLLQARLQTLVGRTKPGQLLVRSVAKVKDNLMPPLSDPRNQDEFIEFCAKHKPDVIIFDTRAACFGYDPATEMDATQSVNRFLIRLRAKGHAVLTTHHMGKNQTQRGRSDNDDHLDLIANLKKQGKAWQMAFKLEWSKIRYGDKLEPFSAEFNDSWQEKVSLADNSEKDADAVREAVIEMSLAGCSQAKIAKSLEIGKDRVRAIQDEARKQGLELPALKPGRKSDSD